MKIDERGVFAVFALIAVLTFTWRHRPIEHAPGILVADSPLQTPPPPNAPKVFKLNEAVAEPLAAYTINGRVLSTERYWFDHGASVAPIDVAIGWGLMSDSATIDKLSISQSLRYYHYRWSDSNPVNPEEIKTHSANMHLIPANETIRDILFSLKTGNLIRLQGYLVKVSGKDGGEWVSSLIRTDTGAGACELMYVQNILVLN